jgi:hypothetical protein
MDTAFLGDLLEAVVERGYDYAKGNRFIAGGLKAMPKHRLIANVLMTFFTKLASGYWNIFDPQNGYTAVRGTVLQRLDLDRLHKGFFFENDMLVSLNLLRCRVADVPIPAVYGIEISDVRPFQILFTFPLLFFQRWLKRIFHNYVLLDFSPIALFLFFGFLLLTGGVGFGLATWIKSYRAGVLTPTGTIALVMLPIILGFQLLLQAIALDMNNTPK